MSKKTIQTKKAKDEFYSPLLNFLSIDRTREDVAGYLNVSERKARDEINTVRKHYAVISGSFAKGYRLAKKFDKMTPEEKEKEKELVSRTIAEFESRIRDMKKSQKPLIAYLRALEKNIDKDQKK